MSAILFQVIGAVGTYSKLTIQVSNRTNRNEKGVNSTLFKFQVDNQNLTN